MERDKYYSFLFDKEKCQKQEGDKRIIEGLATTFGNKDLDGDIIEFAAWDVQLSEHDDDLVVKALWQHQSHNPIGLVDIKKVPAGLFATMRLTPDVKQADEALASAKFGSIDAFSIGFRILEEHFDVDRQANIITRARLREVSPVTFEANPLAKISDVKSVKGMSKKELATFKRHLEVCLRDVAGLSKSFAETIITHGLNGLGDPDDDDGMEKLGDALRKYLPNLN